MRAYLPQGTPYILNPKNGRNAMRALNHEEKKRMNSKEICGKDDSDALERLLVWSESLEGMVNLIELIRQGMDRSNRSGAAYIRHLEDSIQRENGAEAIPRELKKAWEISLGRSTHIEGMLHYFTDLLRPRNPVMESVDPEEVLQEAAFAFRPVFERKKTTYTINTRDAGKVRTDRAYLKHVLMNLIDNALYFSDQGSKIDFSITDPGDASTRIEVRDSGPGIPEEHRNLIFRPFFSTKNVETVGCGLGLPVSRLLLHRIRGFITLDPDYRVGAGFIIHLPKA